MNASPFQDIPPLPPQGQTCAGSDSCYFPRPVPNNRFLAPDSVAWGSLTGLRPVSTQPLQGTGPQLELPGPNLFCCGLLLREWPGLGERADLHHSIKCFSRRLFQFLWGSWERQPEGGRGIFSIMWWALFFPRGRGSRSC